MSALSGSNVILHALLDFYCYNPVECKAWNQQSKILYTFMYRTTSESTTSGVSNFAKTTKKHQLAPIRIDQIP